MIVKRAMLGQRPLTVWVPESAHEKSRGLQDFSDVPGDGDALYLDSGPVTMKELAYPIDVVVLSCCTGRVQAIFTVEPGDVGNYGPHGQGVFELAAGWARRHRLAPGDRVTWL